MGGCTRVPSHAPAMLTKSHTRGTAPESPACCTPSPAVLHAHSVRSPRGWQCCTSRPSVRLPVSVLGAVPALRARWQRGHRLTLSSAPGPGTPGHLSAPSPVSPDSPGAPEAASFGQRRPCPRPSCGQQGRRRPLRLPLWLSPPGAQGVVGVTAHPRQRPTPHRCHRGSPASQSRRGRAAPGRRGAGDRPPGHGSTPPLSTSGSQPNPVLSGRRCGRPPALCPGHADPRAATSPPMRLGAPGTRHVFWTRALPVPASPRPPSKAVGGGGLTFRVSCAADPAGHRAPESPQERRLGLSCCPWRGSGSEGLPRGIPGRWGEAASVVGVRTWPALPRVVCPRRHQAAADGAGALFRVGGTGAGRGLCRGAWVGPGQGRGWAWAVPGQQAGQDRLLL